LKSTLLFFFKFNRKMDSTAFHKERARLTGELYPVLRSENYIVGQKVNFSRKSIRSCNHSNRQPEDPRPISLV
jgi:hypothetical protein